MNSESGASSGRSGQNQGGGGNGNGTGNGNGGDSSRLTVADILSSMANGDMLTPSTYTALEGFSTGIPTRTTPTLTPTTLRNIEQTFIELQSVPPQPIAHQHQAGFVPPVVHPTIMITSVSESNTTSTSSQPPVNMYLGNLTSAVKDDVPWYSTPIPVPSRSSSNSSSSSSSMQSTAESVGSRSTTKTGRQMGGRRPNKEERVRLTPEEEERRRVRRERNKLAAARCRKRRMDHTNTLLNETDCLAEKKQALQKEILELQNQKEHLEFILDAHRCVFKNNGKLSGGNGNPNTSGQSKTHSQNANDHSSRSQSGQDLDSIKEAAVAASESCITVPTSGLTQTTSYSTTKPTRPTSLSISNSFSSSTNLKLSTAVSVSDLSGISLSTPSTGLFNFDGLMEGTGLTPVSSGLTPMVPTCSSQQRSSNSDLSSPDTINSSKLISL